MTDRRETDHDAFVRWAEQQDDLPDDENEAWAAWLAYLAAQENER
jgi:hypothetical protein